MSALVRVPLYAVGALAGVQVANTLRPVQVSATSVAKASGLDLERLAKDALAFNFDNLGKALSGAASKAGDSAEAQIHAQVRANVILGVVGGCLAAGLVDWFIS